MMDLFGTESVKKCGRVPVTFRGSEIERSNPFSSYHILSPLEKGCYFIPPLSQKKEIISIKTKSKNEKRIPYI
uniref:Uncharacterized protein n=1 Tax=Lobelia laxa TaxID=2041130 RepID=A0A291EYU4_9ASTR|nr:hypothetical protein Lo_lxa1Pt0344 [Lobelia laxa]ATG25045.1 hypothetical protein Lo_lxa1Pt0344 [Lobelia laxa]